MCPCCSRGIGVATLVAILMVVATRSALLSSIVVLAAAAIGGVWFAARRKPDGIALRGDFITRRTSVSRLALAEP